MELDRFTNAPCKHVCLFIAIKIQEREKKDFEKKKRTQRQISWRKIFKQSKKDRVNERRTKIKRMTIKQSHKRAEEGGRDKGKRKELRKSDIEKGT